MTTIGPIEPDNTEVRATPQAKPLEQAGGPAKIDAPRSEQTNAPSIVTTSIPNPFSNFFL